MMEKAYPELQKIAKGTDESAHYGCSALAFTVEMNWLVDGQDCWQNRWSDPRKYRGYWDNLCKIFEIGVREASDKLTNLGRLYYYGYSMPHSLVKTHYETARKEAKKEERDSGKLPIGMLWVLAIKSWKEITNS